MGRTRTFEVTESIEELTAELSRQIGTPIEPGLRLLLALRRDPQLSNSGLSEETGLGVSTVKRLLAAYRTGGLPALRERATKVRQPLVATGGLSDVSPPGTISSGEGKYRKVLELVEGVPETIDEMEFLAGMRELLYSILDDVDYLVLVLTGNARLLDPAEEDIRVSFVYIRKEGREGDVTEETAVRQRAPEGEQWRTVLEEGKKKGRIDFARYHPCVGFDLLHTSAGESIPLASVLLFRESTSPPISRETMAFVRELEPLLVLIFLSYITRRQNYRRAEAGFEDLYRAIDPDDRLTTQERRVVMLHAMGYSTREIAEALYIEPKTVESHNHAILEKTGMVSIKKLIAKATTARRDFPERPDPDL